MKLQHLQFDACQRQCFVGGNLNGARDQFIRHLDRSTALVPGKQSIKAIFTPPFGLVVDGFSAYAKHLGNRIGLQLGIDRNDAERLETVVREMVSSGYLFQFQQFVRRQRQYELLCHVVFLVFYPWKCT